MPDKVEGFGFVRNDDVDCLASFLLLGEFASKRDDVGHVGYPCLIEGFGGVSSEMVEDTFDGVTKIFFVEFFDVLFFDSVDDA